MNHRLFRPAPWGRSARRAALPVAAAVLLAACGGGGSGSNGSSAPATVNAAQAYLALTQSARVAALTGTNGDGQSVVGTLAVTPGETATTTPLGTVDVAATALTITQGTANPITNAATYWYAQGSSNWIASFYADGSCSVVTGAPTALPTNAALGSSGTHISAQHLANCSANSLPSSSNDVLGPLTETWSYDTIGGTPYFCIQTYTQGWISITTQTVCAEVLDTAGTLGTQVRITVKDGNGAITTLSN